MTKIKTTKRALFASVISMMLCMAMLVGSTFAWFTDSVTSGKNKIVAGNLDVELEYSLDGTAWTTVTETTNMFKDDALWEPGYTEVVYLRVVNAGSLALKYQFGINVAGKVIGKTADDQDIDLADLIKFGVVEADAVFADRAAARDAVKNTAALISAGYSSAEGHLTAGKMSDMLALVVYMPEEVGNDANYGKGKTQPEIHMGINLVAAQDTVERDSFDEKYDEFVLVANAEELVTAIANGNNVVVNEDIQLPAQLEVSGNITIMGNDTTITAPVGGTRIIDSSKNKEKTTITLSNLNLIADHAERCISFWSNEGGVDLVVDHCTATANKYVLNIASDNPNVNVTVKNSEIVGWCVFQTWSAGTKATFENCTLVGNNTFSYNAEGWNNFATIVINANNGIIAESADLTFKNCRFEANQTTGNMQYLLSVRAPGAKITLENCTFFANGTEIPNEDLGRYIQVYGEAIDLKLTINGELIPIE